METVYLLIILYAGTHTNVVEFTSKEKCEIAAIRVNHSPDGWFRRDAFCVEK